jgi:hypothetical protein
MFLNQRSLAVSEYFLRTKLHIEEHYRCESNNYNYSLIQIDMKAPNYKNFS